MSKQGFKENWHWLMIIFIAFIGVIFVVVDMITNNTEFPEGTKLAFFAAEPIEDEYIIFKCLNSSLVIDTELNELKCIKQNRRSE